MLRSDEAKNWFLQNVDWQGLADHLFLFYLLLIVIGWIMLAGTRAIVGEYFKLFWFRYVHTPRFERAQAALKEASEALAHERAEMDAYKRSVSDLINENDRLLAEVLRLRARRSTPLVLTSPKDPASLPTTRHSFEERPFER